MLCGNRDSKLENSIDDLLAESREAIADSMRVLRQTPDVIPCKLGPQKS